MGNLPEIYFLLRAKSLLKVHITTERMNGLFPVLSRLIERGVKVFVITRDPREHQETMIGQAEAEIQRFERLGIQVFLCLGNDHRKLAIRS